MDSLQKKVIWTSGHATEAGHRDRVQMQVTGTGYRGRSQGQAAKAGHMRSLQRRNRIQRQVTGTGYAGRSQGKVYPYVSRSQRQLQKSRTHRDRLRRQFKRTGYRGRS